MPHRCKLKQKIQNNPHGITIFIFCFNFLCTICIYSSYLYKIRHRVILWQVIILVGWNEWSIPRKVCDLGLLFPHFSHSPLSLLNSCMFGILPQIRIRKENQTVYKHQLFGVFCSLFFWGEVGDGDSIVGGGVAFSPKAFWSNVKIDIFMLRGWQTYEGKHHLH